MGTSNFLFGDGLYHFRNLPTSDALSRHHRIIRRIKTCLYGFRFRCLHQTHIDDCIKGLSKTTLTLLRTSDGVITARRLNEARQEGSFDQIQIFNLLAEIDLGSGLDSVGVIPEINRVEITLQNLVFRAFFFKTKCVNNLQKFVAPITFETAKKFNLDYLLRNG